MLEKLRPSIRSAGVQTEDVQILDSTKCLNNEHGIS